MPDAPTFDKVAPRLYRASSTGDAGLDSYWAGYFTSANADFGDQASWDQVWQDAGGVLLFLGSDLDDASTFGAAFEGLLPRLSPTGLLRVAWITNPNETSSLWQVRRLDAQSTGSDSAIVWTLARQSLFQLGAYALRLDPGGQLEQSDPTAFGYGIAIPSSAVVFQAPGGGYPAGSDSAWLPLAGTGIGCFQAALELEGGESGPDDLAKLGVLLRYSAAVPDSVIGQVEALDMPILSQGGASMRTELRLDPLNHLVSDRSHLGFFSAESGSPPPLVAALRTTLGYGTTLTPYDAPAPLWPGRLAFSRTPISVVENGEPYFDLYLTPDGAFSLSVDTGGGTSELMLGLSGLEYVAVPESGSAIAFFVAGQPAFVPEIAEGTAPTVEQALTDLGTTAWFTLLQPEAGTAGLTYFAQPEQAPFFHSGPDFGGSFLEYLELPAATLPSWESQGSVPPVMPVGAFSGLESMAASLARQLEDAVLAPVRRSILGLPTADLEGLEDASRLAVTPNGLVVEVASDDKSLSGVVLANMPLSVHKQVELTEVGPALQAALQSNQLFFVASNVDTFMSATSVQYQLTHEEMPILVAKGVPQSVADELNAQLAAMDPPYPVFETESAFDAEIGQTAGEYLPICQDVAGLLKSDVEGWTFQLSPRSWRSDASSPTLMLFKYCNRSLEDLAGDTASWGWPAAAETGTAGLGPTQAVLQDIFTEAAAAETGSSLRTFYEQVVIRPSWNGVLFLNAPVSISELPPDLQFMVAGIDTEQFYAHHFGFSLTPFSVVDGAPVLDQTAAFGLISYLDDVDLYADSTVPFAFKTKALNASFANAHLSGFSAEVELLTNRLFSAELAKRETAHGNNLILDGSYQRVGGVPTYSFELAGTNVYGSADSALESIEVLGVTLNTRTSLSVEGDLLTDFTLQGNLRFVQFTPFDAFSYGIAYAPEGETPTDGYLRFSGLIVTLEFNLATPTAQTFTVAEDQLSFDLANSHARSESLVTGFPLALSGLIAQADAEGGGRSPEDLGFASISVPLDQTIMAPPWYGLSFVVELGTLGALAGSVGLTVNLLVAWKPGGPDQAIPLYVGIQLPNAKSLGLDWPLQGIMTLGFRSFEFNTYENDTGQTAYMLLLRRFALRILGLSFPPGNTDVMLFGNPDQTAVDRLGWYACYAQDEAVGTGGDPRLLGTRALPAPPPVRRPAAQRIDRRLRSGRRHRPRG